MPQVECGHLNTPGVSGESLLISLGPTILVDIGFDPSFVSGAATPPISGIQGLRALGDTGATESCIDSLLAAQLNLPIADRRMTSGAHGRQELNMHLAQVHIPSLQFTITGMFAAVHLQAGGQHHFALIGRTFLRFCKMSYDGASGSVIISRP
jgi:hypothetical protein